MNNITGKIVAFRYLSTTGLGNNRYTVAIQDSNGHVEIFDTAPNKSLNIYFRDNQTHTFTRNARGQLTGLAK